MSLTSTPRPLRIIHTEAATSFGGQEHRIFKEMVAMREAGHHLEAICQPRAQLTTRLRQEGFTVHTMEMDGPFHFVRAVLTIRQILKNGAIDVLNTHSRRDTVIAATAGRLAGTPLIIRTRHLANRVNPLLSYTWLPHCVTTDSQFVRNQLITRGVAPERIENIYTPLLKQTPIARSTLREELNLPNSAVVVGCVAVMRANKGHADLVRAMVPLFAEHANLHLVVAGEGAPVFHQIQELVRSLNLQDRVHLLGRREDIPNVMAGFDIFCLATRLEASGMVFLEAAAAGLPIVATAVGGVPEMLEDGRTGLLVQLDDQNSLRAALLKLIDQPILRKQMGQAGYDRIWSDPASPFTPEALVKRTQEVYGMWLTQRGFKSRAVRKEPE